MKAANSAIFRFTRALSYCRGKTLPYFSGLIFLLVSTFVQTLFAQDNYGDWSYSRSITLNTGPSGAYIASDLEHFPVLIRLTPSNFGYFSQTQDNGADIRFAKSDGTHLPYSIERWTDDAGNNDTADIWVLLDTVYGANATQNFMMYWGKSGAVDSSNSSAVFDTADGFVGVWHLDEDPTAGTGAMKDATANVNHATSVGMMTAGDLVDGMIHKGHEMDGTDDGDSIPHSSSLNITGELTISAWIKPASFSAGNRIFAKSHTSNVTPYNIYALNIDGTDHLRGMVSLGGTLYYVDGSTSLTTTDFHYAVFTYDGSILKLYLDGSVENDTTSASGSISTNSVPPIIGKSNYGNGFFDGVIDHVRLSKTARSVAWIKLCHENQQAAQTLVEFIDPLTWDTSTDADYQAGNGTWGSDDYWTTNGTALTGWPGSGSSATFAGSDGTWTVTVSGTQNVDALIFERDGYTLSGGTVNLGTKSGIDIATGKNASISSVISGSGGITKGGGGTLILSGTNTYTGPTVINSGTISVTSLDNGGSDCGIGAADNGAANLVFNGGTLIYTGGAQNCDRLFTLSSGGGTIDASGSGALNLTNAGNVGFFTATDPRTLTLTGSNTGDNTISAVIGDNGGATSLVKSGTGTWVLDGTSTFSGSVTISEGMLRLTSNGGIPTVRVTLSDVSSAVLDINSTSEAIGSLAGGGGTGGNVTLGSGSLYSGYDNTSSTFSGVISGTGTFTKGGSGTMTLAGTNTYTGTTTISNGTLNLTGSTGSGSAVTVASGATIAGTGTTNGPLTVNGMFAPGTSPGTFYAAGGLTFSGSGSCAIEINGTTTPGTDYDQIVVTGSVTLGSAALDVTLGYTPSINDAFTIISNDGSDAVSGTFIGIPDDDSIVVGYGSAYWNCQVSYNSGTDNNDVVLTITSAVAVDNYTQWSHSHTFTLNTTATGADVSGNVLDFPILVRLDPGNFSFFNQTQPEGADIRFSKSDGTHLHYEIERWADFDNDLDSAEIWVKLDTVYGNSNTQQFMMYWGKSDAADSSNSEAVFDTANSFFGTYHLDGDVNNSTMNTYHGTDNGSIDTTSGIIANARAFDGSSQYFHVGDIPDRTSGTVSCWFRPKTDFNSSSTVSQPLYGKYESTSYNAVLCLAGTDYGGGEDGALQTKLDNSGSTYLAGTTNSFTSGTWYYVAWSWGSDTNSIYLNGTQENASSESKTLSGSANDEFGRNYIENVGDLCYFSGTLDEIRLDNTARSADWIKLCYENQKGSQTLVEFENYGNWGFKRQVTINTSGITTTDCINFPLLVRLDENNFDFAQAKTYGGDIRFSKADGKHLAFAIERWDSGNETAEMWVKIDTVYGNNSTQYFNMHWGNGTAAYTTNSEAVFDTGNDYTVTYFLSQFSGTLDDKTSNDKTGIAYGDVPDRREGLIGYAQNFDGAGDYFGAGNASVFDMSADDKLTVSAWVKPAGDAPAGGVEGIVARWRFTASAFEYQLSESSSNGFMFGLTPDGSNYYYCYDPAGVPSNSDDTWYHVAGTMDGSQMVLFIDGDPVDTNSTPDAINYNSSAWLRVGNMDSDGGLYQQYYNGTIDQVELSRTDRSPDWIRLSYETQKPSSTILSCDSADAFRPLTIRRETTGPVTDSIIVATTNWAIRFAADAGGGIDFLAKDSSSTNQLDRNLFYLLYDTDSSSGGTGTLTMLDSSIVSTRIRQIVDVDGQEFALTYNVLGSGRMYIDVTTYAASALSGGLEFRIANGNTASTYNNIQIGTDASTCEGIAHIDSVTGRFDLIMAPFDLWSDADLVTSDTRYTGIKSSSWSLKAGKRFRRQFMVDFSHRNLTDSVETYRYIANYRNEDTLSFYAGTPLLEQAWENHLKGHWKFDEGYGDTVTDNSGNNHLAVIAATPHWTDGYWLGGADSLGGGDSISVAHSTDFDGKTAHTILAWIKPAAALTSAASIVKKYSGGDVGYILGGDDDGTLLYSLNNGGTAAQLAGTSALSPGTWYHVGAQLTVQQDTMKLYINGEVDTVRAGSFGSGFGTNTADLIMGKGFNGVIDDVRFYNDRLYDQDVKAIYLKGFAPELGAYSVRASNDNTLHCVMHATEYLRSLPVLQIKNYWASSLPLYVYIDGVGLTSGTDYFAALDDERNRLTIGLNRVINTDATIFIDDSSDNGSNLVNPTRKMYWGIEGTSDEYFWVKNTSGNTFGSASDNQFYMNWKMDTSSNKDGELWYLLSSVTNPGSSIDTVTGTNLVPGTDGLTSLGGYTYVIDGNALRSVANVQNEFTYTVVESTTTRIRLRVNERQVSNTSSFNIVSHWTIYPTGQIFRYDSIYSISGEPTDLYANVYLDDSTYTTGSYPSVNTSLLRGGINFTQTYPDITTAWLSMKNAAAYQSTPFSEDYIYAIKGGTRVGITFCQFTSSPALWNSATVETNYYIDISHNAKNASSIDSMSNGVQYIGLSGGAALTSIGSGTLITNSAGDLNADGFNEMEGAYIIQANNNTVDFDLPALGDTCRYYPAFRITDYLAAGKPQYIYALDDDDTVALVEGYQYNCHLNQVTRELVIQIDSIFCAATGFYISADQTLAVKMSNFEARAGNGCDTLMWRTESEQENLGYRMLRRVKPSFYDSAFAAYTKADTSAESGIDVKKVGVPRLFKRGSLKAPDTCWTVVNKKLIPGAEKGVSHGPRDYRYVDYQVYNEVLYEYRLVAVDYHQDEEEYGPITVMPRYLFPTKFMLGLNYPNPFRYMTTIRFALPTEAKVSLNIYTLKGQLVRRLITPDKKMPAMYHQMRWDGKNDQGTRVAGGPYIYRMTTSKYRKAKVMLMLR